MLGWKINTIKETVGFSIVKPNIAAPSEPIVKTKKCVFVIMRLADYGLPHTWILYTILLDKYILFSIIRCFSRKIISANRKIHFWDILRNK